MAMPARAFYLSASHNTKSSKNVFSMRGRTSFLITSVSLLNTATKNPNHRKCLLSKLTTFEPVSTRPISTPKLFVIFTEDQENNDYRPGDLTHNEDVGGLESRVPLENVTK